MADWASGRLTDASRVGTPTGKGAFLMNFDGKQAGIVVSPFGIAFEPVRFSEGAGLVLEVTLPHANSDGMSLEFVFSGSDGVRRSVHLPLEPAKAGDPGPRWQRHRLSVPAGVRGDGSLTVIASSPSGNPTSDWAYLREFRLERGRD